MSVGSIIKPLHAALNSYLLPLFVRLNMDYKKIRRLVRKWMVFFGFITALLLIVGYFFGQDIILLLFGEKYANLGLLVFYPFVVQAINIFFEPYKIALDAIKRTDINFWILIPRSIIAVVLGYLLITRFGLAGAFYTMIIENLTYRIAHFILYKRVLGNTKQQMATDR